MVSLICRAKSGAEFWRIPSHGPILWGKSSQNRVRVGDLPARGHKSQSAASKGYPPVLATRSSVARLLFLFLWFVSAFPGIQAFPEDGTRTLRHAVLSLGRTERGEDGHLSFHWISPWIGAGSGVIGFPSPRYLFLFSLALGSGLVASRRNSESVPHHKDRDGYWAAIAGLPAQPLHRRQRLCSSQLFARTSRLQNPRT